MVNDKSTSYTLYTAVIVYFMLMYLNQLAKLSLEKVERSRN
jgi:hypothetical protein